MKLIKLLRYILFPFAMLYGLITAIRNLLFDNGIGSYVSQSFSTPIISVGNITVGGTGKTPHTEWIIRLLQNTHRLAVLSRGYKRKTKGLVIAQANATAAQIGDEPMQMHSKFAGVQVVVSEERVKGIQAIEQLSNQPQVILMDDAYQHRYVKPGMSILIMDYKRPLWKDHLMPVGELRESASGKKRANIIIVSKCPANLSLAEQNYIRKKLNLDSHQAIYFSTIVYKNIYPAFTRTQPIVDLKTKKVLLVSGIASPSLMFDFISAKAKKTQLLQFGDHHNFTDKDLQIIREQFIALGDNAIIVSTEKDVVRFKDLLAAEDILAKHMYSLPIEIALLNDQESELKNKIVNYVESNTRIG